MPHVLPDSGFLFERSWFTMTQEKPEQPNNSGMHRRRITIPGDRYLYFYTFDDTPPPPEETTTERTEPSSGADATEEPDV
jgi:hypothetical protein